MSERNSTHTQICSGITAYYEALQKHIDSISKLFQAKSVIKQNFYNDTMKCLFIPKGQSSGLLPAKFVLWAKTHFLLITIAGADVVCCIKSKKPAYIYEEHYNIISEAHINISHGGRDKTMRELNLHYSWITRFAIEVFIKQPMSPFFNSCVAVTRSDHSVAQLRVAVSHSP